MIKLLEEFNALHDKRLYQLASRQRGRWLRGWQPTTRPFAFALGLIRPASSNHTPMPVPALSSPRLPIPFQSLY
jgi:hypothetical protein